MSLRERMDKGAVFTAWSYIASVLTVDALAGTQFDAVTLDMQHGGHNEESVLHSVAPILRHGKFPVARIPVGRFDMVSRALDFGVEAVIAPMINSVEDAKALAEYGKYPPMGGRSWGPSRALSLSGQTDIQTHLKTQNNATTLFAMIETAKAFDQLDAILGVDGIDGVFVGPADFSIALTDGAKVDPNIDDMLPNIEAIATRARASGKYAAIFATSPQMAAQYRDMGYHLIAISGDNTYITLGANGLLAQLK